MDIKGLVAFHPKTQFIIRVADLHYSENRTEVLVGLDDITALVNSIIINLKCSSLTLSGPPCSRLRLTLCRGASCEPFPWVLLVDLHMAEPPRAVCGSAVAPRTRH
jgi:hypothetical protein